MMLLMHTTDITTIDAVLVGEAARILDVSADTVRAWARTGRLPAVRTRKGVRLFDRRDVEQLARERAQASVVDSTSPAAKAEELVPAAHG